MNYSLIKHLMESGKIIQRYFHFSGFAVLFKVDNALYAADHFPRGGIYIRHLCADGMLRADRYAAAAAFTSSLIMYGLSFNQRYSRGETIFHAGPAAGAFSRINTDAQSLKPDKGIVCFFGKVLCRAHNRTAATAAETYCKEPAPVRYSPEKIVHAHTAGKRDKSIIHLAFHMRNCLIDTYVPRDPRVDLGRPVTKQNTGIFDRMILTLVVVTAGAAFDDYTM
jgi:hypothetical protein